MTDLDRALDRHITEEWSPFCDIDPFIEEDGEDYDNFTTEELIELLADRDNDIDILTQEKKKLREEYELLEDEVFKLRRKVAWLEATVRGLQKEG